MVALGPFFTEERARGRNGAGRGLCLRVDRGMRLYHPIRTTTGSRGHLSSPTAPRWSRSGLRTPVKPCQGRAGPRVESFQVRGPRGRLCSQAEDTRLEVGEWGDVTSVYVCVPAPSAPWDRRLEEGNCAKCAELPRGWGLEGTPLGSPGLVPRHPCFGWSHASSCLTL